MKNKRIPALLLAALLLSSAVSCAGPEETVETTAETVPAAETEAETELKAELPDKTYNGEEVMFLTCLSVGYDWYTSYEIYAAEMNGQLINDAVYTRNQQIEELLDIRIAETKMENAHNIAQSYPLFREVKNITSSPL